MKQQLTTEEVIELWRSEHGAHKANCTCWYCDTARRLQDEVKTLRKG